MSPHLLVFLVAFAVSFLVTMIIKRISARIGLLDMPDMRKIHKLPIPYLGGVAVFTGLMMGLSVALHLDRPFRYEFLQQFIGLFVGTAVIFLLGIFDDLGGSTATTKFSFQAIAATICYWYGFKIDRVTNPFGGIIELGPILGWFITCFWFAALTNAMNLIDGLDGLCAGVGAIVAVTLFMIGVLRAEVVLPFIALALAGALIGFLPHNFHPARIFLGDTGSMTTGFLIAAMGLITYTKATTLMALLVPMAALAVPIADTALAIFRRHKLGRDLFTADQGHIHHRLLKILPHRRAVILIYIATSYFCLLALGLVLLPKEYSVVGVGLVLLSAAGGIFFLRAFEARSLSRRGRSGDLPPI